MKKLLTFLILRAVLLTINYTNGLAYIRVGDTAANFTLVSVAGDTIKLSDYAGQPVLLNFFHYN